MKILNSIIVTSLLVVSTNAAACVTSQDCSASLAKAGITSKACVNAAGQACSGSELAALAQQYSVQSGATAYGFDQDRMMYAIRTNAAGAAALMGTALITSSKTCSATRSSAGFYVFDNTCLSTSTSSTATTATTTTSSVVTTTTAAAAACGGNLNNCIPILQDRGYIAASQPCTVNGAACALNQYAPQAAKLAISLNAPGYAYNTQTGQIFAIRINSNLAASILSAQKYYKVGSATCSGVALTPLYIFDTSCLAAQLSSTTVKPTTTTTHSSTTVPTTSKAPTTTTTPPGTIIQCGQVFKICSENTNLIQPINCASLAQSAVCKIGNLIDIVQASINVCLTNSCASYGYFGTNIFSSQSTVAEIRAAVAGSVATKKCTNPFAINISDRQCIN